MTFRHLAVALLVSLMLVPAAWGQQAASTQSDFAFFALGYAAEPLPEMPFPGFEDVTGHTAFTTDFAISNGGSEPAEVRIRFFDSQGAEVEVQTWERAC